MPSAVEWVESLEVWPEEFGLGRMRVLLDALGEPQLRYPSVHVVGTNGKSTATRTIEEHLAAAGLAVGAYLSPHVRGWSERIRVRGEEADFERAIERVRPAALAVGATQFEAVTAAALAEFAAASVDAAVLEAGLGGRHDATNVVDASVVLLTNVDLEHTEVLGSTREEIAREKLAVAGPGATVVLPDREFAPLVPQAQVLLGGAREAAEAFLGARVEGEVEVTLPGRLEWRSDRELWDGGHNAAGAAWLAERLPGRDFVLVVSILADKDARGMLRELRPFARGVVATTSSNPRARAARELAEIAAELRFGTVDAVDDPEEALDRARTLAGGSGAVLVTGSLYLLADLARREEHRVE
jgi:dihydrofolate synthase/folylpolyglutamate synthase